MNLQVRNRIRKVLAYTLTGIAFAITAAFLALQIPAVQEYFIKRYLTTFSSITGFQTTIGSFQLLWFDRLEMTDVMVRDPEKNEMIAIDRVVINFKLSQLVEQRDVNIDGVGIDGARVLVTRVSESDTSTNFNINLFVDRINEKFAGSGTGAPPIINIGEAVFEQSTFTFNDPRQDSIRNGFDHSHFKVHIDESQLRNFLILGDTTQFQVITLLARDEATKFTVKQLSTFFRLSQQSMDFLGLTLDAGESHVSDTISFTFNGQEQLNDFVSLVHIDAKLKNTVVQPQDLALFAPGAEKLREPLRIDGRLQGRINDFRFSNMSVGYGNSTLRGSLQMEGLPDLVETFMVIQLEDSQIDFNDLSFVLDDQILNRLTPMGRVSLESEFIGYLTDFVAKGQFAGKLGEISSDINFKVNEKNFDLSIYSGKLALKNFDIGRYLGDTTNFQKVNLNGNVKGSGLTAKTADFILNGQINSIGIRKYNYSNIVTNARFASQLFNGYLKIDDPNLRLTAEGSVDLRPEIQAIKIEATLDTANLQQLNISPQPVFVSSKLNVDTRGLHLDSITGKALLNDFHINYRSKQLDLQQVFFNSERNNSTSKIGLTTDLVSATVEGDFVLTDIVKDIQRLIQEMRLNLRNNATELQEYYARNKTRNKSYKTDFEVQLHNIRPLTDLFDLDVSLSNNTLVEGQFTSGYTSILQAYSFIDTLKFRNAIILNTDFELTASKIADSTDVLASAIVDSERQIFTNNFKTKNLLAEAIWNDNHVDFHLDADQEDQSNYVRINGEVDFLRDSTRIKILPSTVQVLEKVWTFDPENRITFAQEEITVSHLGMRNDNQFIRAAGTVSQDPSKTFVVELNDVDLSQLTPVIGRPIDGTVNAVVELANYFNNPSVQNELSVDSLSFDNFLIGDISGRNVWDTVENRFDINFYITRNESRIVDIEGYYNPALKESPLNVNATLKNANLRILQPFLEDIFLELNGTASGDFKITGRLREPEIRGKGFIPDGVATVEYLKTSYTFKGTVGLTPASIYFEEIDLKDVFGNQAKLEGTIIHRNFFQMSINLNATFQNFQVLNTTARDNSLFYGQGYATGDVSIYGPVENLKITANARTDKNTRISIPIGTTSEVEKKEFIKFVSFADSAFQQTLSKQIEQKIDLTGITMDFNLAVTSDAYCEIILDYKAGDIIRGRGTGDLQFQLDTKGDFNMFGPFEFTEGYYNFTLYDIVNKEFEIKKGSRINWYGDAYEGILDISATYNQLASFHTILTDQSLADQPQLRRKYPVQVLLDLDGPMLKPQINFDIVANDLPQSIVVEGGTPVRLDFEFRAFKNRIDEQELYRQVFSLIVLRRFSPLESFNTSGSLANSVSELLSNQLSNWISQVDENLEIDIDMSTFDQEAFNTFQLRLSYSFLNGRLRITRDGTYTYGNANNAAIAGQQQNSLSTIAGDWTVDYLLTADGKLRVKMFNRTNINPVLNSISQNQVTTGVSITHVQSFNQLKDIWRAARNRRRNNRTAPEEIDSGKQVEKGKSNGSE